MSFSLIIQIIQILTLHCYLYDVFLLVGHSELICSPQPITVLAGDDVILPCCLESAISATSGRVEWTKPGLDPEYVHVHRDGRLQYQSQNPSYYYRTRLFVDELRNGNVSMKISEVKISDKGTYKCFLPSEQQEAFVQLNVGKSVWFKREFINELPV